MMGWILLVVFFGIIIVLIVVASVGARKDKVEKMVESDKKEKEYKLADSSRVTLFISLNKLILEFEEEMIDFKPSVGTKSLGEINKHYADIIKKITHSEEMKQAYSVEDYKIELKPIIDEISRVKPSNWTKDATFSINLIKVKSKSILQNKDNKEYVEAAEAKEWN